LLNSISLMASKW